MKLAKYHKTAIVRAVFNDIKRRPVEDLVKEIQEKLYKEMGKEARALYRNILKPWQRLTWEGLEHNLRTLLL